MIDGDVYLTGSHHPLYRMKPLADEKWHIQFQTDRHGFQSSDVNIGWYWARPTPVVREFFSRSQERWLKNTTKWDQDIMNSVRQKMFVPGKLQWPASEVLNADDYRSAMLFDWSVAYTNETAIDEMNANAVIVHYTMLFDTAKLVLAKQFGHWLNQSYYQNSPKILQPINIAGSTNETIDQIALAVYISNVTKRAFMWPNSINHSCWNYTEGWKALPPILFADAGSVGNATSWVEGMYLRNRRAYTNDTLTQLTITLRNVLGWGFHSVDTLIAGGQQFAHIDVLTVDFSGFNKRQLEGDDGVRRAIRSLHIEPCIKCEEMKKYSRIPYPVGC